MQEEDAQFVSTQKQQLGALEKELIDKFQRLVEDHRKALENEYKDRLAKNQHDLEVR